MATKMTTMLALCLNEPEAIGVLVDGAVEGGATPPEFVGAAWLVLGG
jgi:hypothetical protein